MAKIKSECPICKKKDVHEIKHSTLNKFRFITLSCGHSYTEKLSVTKDEIIRLEDGKILWKFQVEGVHFAERSSFRCLIADQQGLGKTIQSIALLKLHWNELKPILIICKGGLTLQWQKHILLGLGMFAQILNRKSDIIPGLNIWIMSFDMTHKLSDEIKKLGIKTIIADEVQMIKNHDAKRTQGIREIVRG